MRSKINHREKLKSIRLVDEVRDLMRQSGWSQVGLANRFDVSRSTIEDLMNDKHCPSADLCQRMYEDLAGRPLLLVEQALKGIGPQ